MPFRLRISKQYSKGRFFKSKYKEERRRTIGTSICIKPSSTFSNRPLERTLGCKTFGELIEANVSTSLYLAFSVSMVSCDFVRREQRVFAPVDCFQLKERDSKIEKVE
jgi:hypothetical protein